MCQTKPSFSLSFYRTLFPFEGTLPIKPWSSDAHEDGSAFDQKSPPLERFLKTHGSWYPKSAHARNKGLEWQPCPHRIVFQAIVKTWLRDCNFYDADLIYCDTWNQQFFLGSFLLRWGLPFWCYPSWSDFAQELCSLGTIICHLAYRILLQEMVCQGSYHQLVKTSTHETTSLDSSVFCWFRGIYRCTHQKVPNSALTSSILFTSPFSSNKFLGQYPHSNFALFIE